MPTTVHTIRSIRGTRRGWAGFQLGEGRRVDTALWLDPRLPHTAHLTPPAKILLTRTPWARRGPWAPEVTLGPGGDPDPKFGKKMKMGCLESARRGGSENSSFAMDLVKKLSTVFNAQNNFRTFGSRVHNN